MSAYERIYLPSMEYDDYRKVIKDIRLLNEQNKFPHFNVGYSEGKYYIIFCDPVTHLQMLLAGEDEILAKLIDKRIYDCL